jgi:hypothetical protein
MSKKAINIDVVEIKDNSAPITEKDLNGIKSLNSANSIERHPETLPFT